MKRRVSVATQVVQSAQRAYPKNLQGAVNYLGQPPYGTERVDSRTYDARIARMTDDDLAGLQQSDPRAYADAQKRLQVLRGRAAEQTTLPAQDLFEEK